MNVEVVVFWMVIGGGGIVAALRVVRIYGEDILGFVRWYRRFKRELREDRTAPR